MTEEEDNRLWHGRLDGRITGADYMRICAGLQPAPAWVDAATDTDEAPTKAEQAVQAGLDELRARIQKLHMIRAYPPSIVLTDTEAAHLIQGRDGRVFWALHERMAQWLTEEQTRLRFAEVEIKLLRAGRASAANAAYMLRTGASVDVAKEAQGRAWRTLRRGAE